jgi:type IV secretion system protein VirB10
VVKDEGRGAATAAAAFRLRGPGPQVVRLSRRVLAGLAGAGALGVALALMFALGVRGRSGPAGSSELLSTDHKTTPDGLAVLPRDYVVAPQNAAVRDALPALPPLAGDAGRLAVAAPGLPFPDPEHERVAQEDEAARTSRLFTTVSAHERAAAASPAAPADKTATPAAPEAPLDPGALVNMQDRKLAFVTAATDRRTVTPGRLEDPLSRYVVQAGSVIPAALITGIRSDLPGAVTAQVTTDVSDTPTGRWRLIPQGAKLIGAYDSQVAFGQDRVLLVWTRLILPNGRSIVLEREPGADSQGFTGLEDDVDQHWGRLAMGAALSTLLGIGTELGATGSGSAVASALRQGASNSLSQTGQQVVGRTMNIQPTLTVRPGFPVRVIVNRDLVLAPYRD